MVGVAQLVERRVVVADVAGSSPVTHPDREARTDRSGPRSFRRALATSPGPRDPHRSYDRAVDDDPGAARALLSTRRLVVLDLDGPLTRLLPGEEYLRVTAGALELALSLGLEPDDELAA